MEQGKAKRQVVNVVIHIPEGCDSQFEYYYRKFKRAVEPVLAMVKKKQYYVKPSLIAHWKLCEAKRRSEKKLNS